MATPADQIAAILRAAVRGAIEDSEPTYEKAAQDAATAADASLRQGLFGGGLGFADVVGLIPGVGGILGPALGPLGGMFGKAGEFILGVGSGWALGEFFAKVLEPVWLPIIHAAQAELTNQIFDPDTAARLYVQGLMQHGHAADEAAGGGFDGAHFDHLAALNTLHPSMAELFELMRRGKADQGFVETTLKRLGYSDEAITKLIALERNLLSPADFALAYLRSDIGEGEMLSRGLEAGVVNEDMQLLVGNTGEPLGLQELLEAYRREFINKDRLERGIRQSRVRNEWIDVAEALQYEPMSTADAVRAVVENYLHSDEGKTIAAQNGLKPEHWDTLVKSWGRPLAHMEMASLVHRGLAPREAFDQAMRESDLKDKYIGLAFDIATPLLPERLIVTAIHYGAIDLQTGSRMLLERGYSQESVGILLKLGLREAAGAHHDLTRAEITQLYAEGGLHRDEALAHLKTLGYSDQTAGYLLELVDLKQHASAMRAEVSAIRISFLAGGIDEMHATTQLRQAGVTDAVAQHDIELWKREKHRAARSLSYSQIIKAAKNGTIQPDEAINLLEGIGYSKADAGLLLISNNVALA